ncbi:MAG: hypothetical protein ACMUHX_04370 [bacterium]
MAGQIKHMINSIVQQRAQGNKAVEHMTMAKLILKGIDPNKYTEQTEDDPAILSQLENLSREL